MAKAKKKRVSKEIDKLWRNARYWQWLRLVEQEGLVKDQSAQWQEAWRHLCRGALRLPGQLEEFWHQLEELKNIPDYPDVFFLRLLKGFLEGQEVRPAIIALAGLSPAVRLFRDKLLAWSWDSVQDKKIEKSFKILINQPEKVTGRTFTELGALLAPNPLSETIQSLSESINQVRKFNSKTAKGNRSWVGPGDRDLKILDNRLARISASLDPVLREVLLYPFTYQAGQFFERLVDQEDFTELAHLAAVIPFLFSQAAGPQAEYLKDRCRTLAGKITTEKEAVDYLKQALPQDLETKVAALGQVRAALASLDPSERLLGEFYLFYARVLEEIGKRQKGLSPREKIELMRVMDPIIFDDLRWIPGEPFDDLFLKKTIESGCAGALTCILVLLRSSSDGALRRKALANLPGLPYPGDLQIGRVLANLDHPILPEVGLVKPLLELYPAETNLRKTLFDILLQEGKMFLLINALSIEYEKSAKDKKRSMQFRQNTVNALRNNLNDLNDYEEAVLLKDLFECFPEGYLSENGYHSLFLKIYSRQKSFDYLFSQVNEYLIHENLLGLGELLFSPIAREWLDKQEHLLFDFVMEYSNGLQTASFEDIHQVVDRFCHPEFMAPKGLKFFLGLGNRLTEWIEAGEAEAEELQNRIMSLLLKYRQTGKRQIGKRTGRTPR